MQTCEKLLKAVEDIGSLQRDVRDVEEQVRKLFENYKLLLIDIKICYISVVQYMYIKSDVCILKIKFLLLYYA